MNDDKSLGEMVAVKQEPGQLLSASVELRNSFEGSSGESVTGGVECIGRVDKMSILAVKQIERGVVVVEEQRTLGSHIKMVVQRYLFLYFMVVCIDDVRWKKEGRDQAEIGGGVRPL